jgi:hypothetical protein
MKLSESTLIKIVNIRNNLIEFIKKMKSMSGKDYEEAQNDLIIINAFLARNDVISYKASGNVGIGMCPSQEINVK